MYHNISNLYFYHPTYDSKPSFDLHAQALISIKANCHFLYEIETKLWHNHLQRGSINMIIYKDGDQIYTICTQISWVGHSVHLNDDLRPNIACI